MPPERPSRNPLNVSDILDFRSASQTFLLSMNPKTLHVGNNNFHANGTLIRQVTSKLNLNFSTLWV